MSKRVALVLLMLCGGCRGLRGDLLDRDEQDTADSGGDTNLASQSALGLADDLFQFDPTLDATKTAAENAAAVQMSAMSQMIGCGMVTLNGTTVTIAFGAPPGCTLKSGKVVSGTVTLGVSKTGNTIGVMATFMQLVVDGTDLSGTIAFSTTNGSTLMANFNLTSKGSTLAGMMTVLGSPGSMSLDGTLSQTKSGKTTSAVFTSVVWKKGDCYPSAGSIKVTQGLLSGTVTFLATTPQTGDVTFKIGVKTSTIALPAYGKCPPA